MKATRQLVLAADLTSVREARRGARETMHEWGLEAVADDVQLGVSELVTNAVRHARTGVVMPLALDGKVIVEVKDSAPALRHPATPTKDPLATSGRGLQIVSAVSADWGVRSVPDGKVVWFALALPDDARVDADVHELSERREEHERAAREQSRRDAQDAADRDADDSREMQARAAR